VKTVFIDGNGKKNSNDENFEWVYKNHKIKNILDKIINFNYELETIVLIAKMKTIFTGGTVQWIEHRPTV
jgi:hypothetical protein